MRKLTYNIKVEAEVNDDRILCHDLQKALHLVITSQDFIDGTRKAGFSVFEIPNEEKITYVWVHFEPINSRTEKTNTKLNPQFQIFHD